MTCTCLVILLHHLTNKPYRDSKVNLCESISLSTLVVIALINLTEVTFVAAGVDPIGPNKTYFTVMQWLQIVILGFLPAVLCVMIVFTLLSQIVRISITAAKLLTTVVTNLTCYLRNRETTYTDGRERLLDLSNSM